MDWPPNSADLNPIENLWEIRKADVHAKNTTREPMLITKTKEAWLKLQNNQVLANLVESMPKAQSQNPGENLPREFFPRGRIFLPGENAGENILPGEFFFSPGNFFSPRGKRRGKILPGENLGELFSPGGKSPPGEKFIKGNSHLVLGRGKSSNSYTDHKF